MMMMLAGGSSLLPLSILSSQYQKNMKYDRIRRKMVSENCRTTGVSLPERQWQRINQDRGQTLVSAFIQQIIDEHYNYKDKIESYQGSSNSNTSNNNDNNLNEREVGEK